MPNLYISEAITPETIGEYAAYLRKEERSGSTIQKYVHDLRAFFSYVAGQEWSKEILIAWKEELNKTYAPASINSMLAAVNSFLNWIGLPQFKVKPIKIQRNLFANPEQELTLDEYYRLVNAAKKDGNRRLSLILQTICSTGIRVSELQYITVMTLQTRRVLVECKGKNRTVFLPKELCNSLHCYCKEKKITSGVIFCTKGGKAIDRSNIWRMMKNLCESAGVLSGKVFPHNLRHLFARTYYSMEKDLSRLADLLGHSSINTTKIYTAESGREHVKQLERMHFILSRE